MVLGQNTCECRQGFLGAIFVVTGDEDEVLALAGATFALIDKGSRRVEQRGCADKAGEKSKENFIHSKHDRDAWAGWQAKSGRPNPKNFCYFQCFADWSSC